MNFVYEYDICALVIAITLIFGFVRKKSIKTRLRSSFMMLVLFVICATLFELITIYFINHPGLVPNWLFYLIDIFHYMCNFATLVAYTNCLFFVIEERKRKKLKYRKLIYLVYHIQILIIIISPFTKFVFYLDNNLAYHHGPGLLVISGLSIFYLLTIIITMIIERKSLTTPQIFIMTLYVIMTILLGIEAMLAPEYLHMQIFSIMFVLLIYLSWYNPSNYYDKISELYNRSAFMIVANEKLIKSKKYRIIALKIHGIKYIHNIIGTDNKITLQKEISELLKTACEGYDVFVISSSKVCVIIPDDEELMEVIVERINKIFEKPFKVNELKLSFQTKMLTLNCPEQAPSVDDAIDIIETVLNKVDETETGKTIKATKDELTGAVREHKIQVLLKEALKNDGLYVVYQPIFSVENNRYTTAEALVRLKATEDGYIGPDEFIPVAEKNGLILQIGEFVFRKVCDLIISEKIWEKGIDYIHVNLSVVQCMQEKLYNQLFKIMDEYDLDYKYINLEVTETTAIASSDMLKVNMEKMIDKKINFSLDDFGSGFSNMSTLVEYPFHTIKIDKVIIDSAFKDEKAKTILRNTIKMIKQLKMEIVAEGVESEEQVNELKEMGCNYIQGYYYSKPLAKEDFMGLLR